MNKNWIIVVKGCWIIRCYEAQFYWWNGIDVEVLINIMTHTDGDEEWWKRFQYFKQVRKKKEFRYNGDGWEERESRIKTKRKKWKYSWIGVYRGKKRVDKIIAGVYIISVKI